MSDLRFGVVGVGVMGRVHAQNLAARVPGARLVAIADRSSESGEACASMLGVESVYSDAVEMFAATGLDGVVISTPADTHADIIEAAARYGVHAFVEKPLERSLAGADEAISAVERAGVKLQVGFQRRFDASVRSAFDSLRAGHIGSPLSIHIVARDPSEPGTRKPPEDLFIETTIHDLDVALWMLDSEPEWILATGEHTGADLGTPQFAVTVVQFANGAVATIDNNRLSVYGYDQRLEIAGTAGMLSVGNERLHTAMVSDAEGAHLPRLLPFFIRRYEAAYIEELRDFVRCIREDSAPTVNGADGRRALALALAAWKSYGEGRSVIVKL